jgi:epoxide hydrolase-like predicted phosphatase
MAGVRVVISDFGGVLTNPLEEAFFDWQAETGIQLEDLGAAMLAVGEQLGENPLYRLEKGLLAEAEFERLIEQELRRSVGPRTQFVDFAEFYFSRLFPNEPFLGFLREYKSDGGRLALLTNNVREWEHRWRGMLPIDELFETVVDSGFVGLRKPEPEIYHLTFERVRALPGLGDVAAAECVLVDDIEANCHAAREFGFAAVRYAGSCDDVLAELRPQLAGRG